MGFFSFLFGKKKQTEKINSSVEDQSFKMSESGAKFDVEIVEAYKRYYSDPASDISLDSKDQNGKSVPSYLAYPQIFRSGLKFSLNGIECLYFMNFGIIPNWKNYKTGKSWNALQKTDMLQNL